MARLSRITVPGVPHHVTQRGNRRQQTFFDCQDYQFYLRNLSELATSTETHVTAYCLMPNHVHLVLTPNSRESLVAMVSDLHQRYTRYINFKKDWRGHLWQGRFFSVALSPEHFDQCIRYVELNPIRANLVDASQKYEWVSDNLRIEGHPRILDDFSILREMTRTGRPRGDKAFLTEVRNLSGIDPTPGQPGRRPRSEINP